MSARISALLGLMCRVQSNRRLRHKTISINVKGVVNCQNLRDNGPPEGNSARG